MDWHEAEDRCERVFIEFAQRGDLSACAAAIEAELRALAETPFHRVIGKSFLHLTEPAADYLIDYLQAHCAQQRVKAIYVEMNGFPHNTDLWFCNAFALSRYEGGENGYQWLAEWCSGARGPDFPLTGMEDLQQVYATHYRGPRMAAEIFAEYLIVARFNELIATAHGQAQRREPLLARMPVLCTAHEAADWTVGESR